MLNKTLSVITAIVIGTSGLSADAMDKSVSVSINPDLGSKKSVIVVDTSSAPQVVAPVAHTAQPRRVVQQPQAVAPRILKPTAAQVIQPTASSTGYEDTIVYASGAKNYYEVGESIKIKLHLKRKAFIYFWTIGSSGNSYRILPNNLESYNYYQANTDYVVPPRSAAYDFVSDREGIEQVYVLATNKKINQAKLESIFSQRAGGIVPMATNKSIREFITKDIQVIARTQNLKYDIESFQVQVRNKNAAANVNIYINQ
jgi:hypothetical protein